MLRNISFENSFKLFGALMLIIIGFCLDLIIKLYIVSDELDEMERVRYKMVIKADELRQSSADLTDFARRYVVTGDTRYLDNYHAVLNIRSGKIARPNHYEAVYWDLLEPMRSERHPPRSKVKLINSLKNLPFSPAERGYLVDAENNSNNLVTMEEAAFAAVKPVFANGKPVRIEDERQHFAINLLHSDAYNSAKNQIMLPIDYFLVSLSKRMSVEIAAKEQSKLHLLESIPTLLVLNAALLLSAFLLVNRKLKNHHTQLEEIGLSDELTGIRNRRFALSSGERLLSDSIHAKSQTAVMLMDIDHFKKVNDTYGHDTGDAVLKEIANLVAQRTRTADVFARYGGEEFIFVLGNIDLINAVKFANSIREVISKTPVNTMGHEIFCTVSIGVSMSESSCDLNQLINNADKALYLAKDMGRNRVRRYEKPTSTSLEKSSCNNIRLSQ